VLAFAQVEAELIKMLILQIIKCGINWKMFYFDYLGDRKLIVSICKCQSRCEFAFYECDYKRSGLKAQSMVSIRVCNTCYC